ncbi:MAG: ATP-grasp domain-containing protein [Acaryochloridaceae cyanobacterium RU_4_10]|nr:ATP-grasp domain-containing protein [Acaryochloridaceae cyanobacterium RU_4_10]
MRVLYPENPLNKTQVDDPYHEEFTTVYGAGYQCSLFDFDALTFEEFNPRPKIQPGERVLYRGWMLNSHGYKTLATQIERKGGIPITSYADYLRCHHLPGWYQQCVDFTAETYFLEADETLETKIQALGWERYFVKDFVKSNTAGGGSIANSPSEVRHIVDQIATYRGEIEGGVAIRRVENYLLNTEFRYFVVRGLPYSHDGEIPTLVKEIANIIDAPFYSVDVAENLAGELRLVELGDGQVSDKKTWPISKFLEVITANA